MTLSTMAIKNLVRFLLLGMVVTALAACGFGGGGGPVLLPLPVGHGLMSAEITVPPGVFEEHGNVVISCPDGAQACVVVIADDGSASYKETGGMPSVMPALESQELPAGHVLTAGQVTVEPGGEEEHDHVLISCPADGAACVVVAADDGSASYQKTGGTPALVPAPVAMRLPAGLGRTVATLNDAPPFVRRNVANRMAVTANSEVTSSTPVATGRQPANGSVWNTGVSQTSSDTDVRAINAWHVDSELTFERINYALGLVHGTGYEPPPPGYLVAISPTTESPEWKGVEHSHPTSSGRYYSVFYSDIENGDDLDYLALGYWVWTPGPDVDRVPFVGAAASGNDPFHVWDLVRLEGRATYEGAAVGLYTARGETTTFHGFGAGVRMTADFDQDRIEGLLMDGRDPVTGEPLFDGLTLGTAALHDKSTFFRGEVSGVLGGKEAAGQWGGQFFGNGVDMCELVGDCESDLPDPCGVLDCGMDDGQNLIFIPEAPRAVAGTFGARAVEGDSLVGVFGAYRQ